MTWITFTVYLLVGYIVYYTLNVLFDLLKKPTTSAGEIETLTVSDVIETIEVDDDEEDVVVTENNSGKEIEQSNINLKKEVTETQEEEQEEQEQIIPSTVVAEVSKTGGISITNLAKLYREESIRESNKLPFAS